jgi:hypothetical protein
MLADPGLFLGAFAPDLSAGRRLYARAVFPRVRRRVISSLGIGDTAVEHAYRKVRAAGERFRAELHPSGYLGADGFSVADLTLAALASPAVAPEQFPYPQPQRRHPLLEPIREVLIESGIFDWTEEMYTRHRGTSTEITQ